MTQFPPIPYIQKLSRTPQAGSQGLVFRRFSALSGQEA